VCVHPAAFRHHRHVLDFKISSTKWWQNKLFSFSIVSTVKVINITRMHDEQQREKNRNKNNIIFANDVKRA
jgi:hypothetical protein